MVTTIDDINLSDVKIMPPKKYDESYLCKVYYGSEDVHNVPSVKGGKFVISLHGVKVVKLRKLSENSFYCYIKVPGSFIPHMLALEEHIVDISKGKCREWFSHKIKHSTIEDSFQSSVNVHKDYGKILKIRIENPQHDIVKSIQESSMCDLQVRLHSIKFNKHSFLILYDVEQSLHDIIKSCNTHECLFNDENDDDLYEDALLGDNDLGPGEDELEQIRQDLIKQLKNRIDMINKQLESLQGCARNLEEALQVLSDKHRPTLKDLDRVSLALRDCDE